MSVDFFKGGQWGGATRTTIVSLLTFVAVCGSIQLAYDYLGSNGSPNYTGLGPGYFFTRAGDVGVGDSENPQLQGLLLRSGEAVGEGPTADSNGRGGNGEVNDRNVQVNATELRQEGEGTALQPHQQESSVGEPQKVLEARGPEQAPDVREREKVGDPSEEVRGGVQQALQVTGQEQTVDAKGVEEKVEVREPEQALEANKVEQRVEVRELEQAEEAKVVEQIVEVREPERAEGVKQVEKIAEVGEPAEAVEAKKGEQTVEVREPEQAEEVKAVEHMVEVREQAEGVEVEEVEQMVEVREGEQAVEAKQPEQQVNAVWHSWGDEELFRQALSVEGGSGEGGGRKRRFKIAFLFMTYKDIPLAPFWQRYFMGNERSYSVYVHVSTPGFQLDPSRKGFYGRQIPSGEVSRFASSMVNAERRLLANALLDPLNIRFILLSESCIPVRSFRGLYRYLIKKDAKSNLESFKSFSSNGKETMGGRWSEELLPLVPMDKFRKGSQWFEMHRRHARLVVEDDVYWGPLKEKWIVPDEHYIPSFFLLRGIQDEITGTSLTHVEWSSGNHDGHPKSYSPEEVQPSLITSLQSASRTTFFGRKFGEETLPALLNLPANVLGF